MEEFRDNFRPLDAMNPEILIVKIDPLLRIPFDLIMSHFNHHPYQLHMHPSTCNNQLPLTTIERLLLANST